MDINNIVNQSTPQFTRPVLDELKKTNKELQEANDKLETANLELVKINQGLIETNRKLQDKLNAHKHDTLKNICITVGSAILTFILTLLATKLKWL